jgi:hypothetical protein
MSISSTQRFSVDRLQPAHPAPAAAMGTVRLPGLINWVKGQVLGYVTGTLANAVHRLTATGTLTGGTIRLVYGNDITAPIIYSATAATFVANIQAAMDALVGAGNTVVSGTGPFDITFQNELAGRSIPIPSIVNALTGTSPVITPTLQTAGHPGSGLAGVYNDALSNGQEVAKCVLAESVATNLRGEIITDRPGNYPSAPVYTFGPFFVSDLVGLDANAVTDLGRIINGTISTSGAVLMIG